MKRLYLILCFTLIQITGVAQNESNLEQVINKRIPKATNGADSVTLIADFVNMRSHSSIDSPVVANLRQHTPIHFLKQRVHIKSKTYSNDYWIKISTPTDSGYVHSSLVMFPKHQVVSKLDSNIYFVQSEEKLAVIKSDSIIYCENIPTGYIDTLHSRGNMGLDYIEVLSAKYSAEYCGGYNGSSFYCWDGKSFFPCGGNGYTGDGAYSEDGYTKFPSEHQDGTQHIRMYYDNYESISIHQISDISNSIEFNTSSTVETFEYDGDTLKPISYTPKPIFPETAYGRLLKDKLKATSIPSHSLKIDFNGDQIEDVIFLYKNVLYFALSDSSETLNIQSKNQTIPTYIKHISLGKYNDGIALNILRKNGESERVFRRIEFKYDDDLKQLIVNRTIDAFTEDSDSGWDEHDIQHFKTKKLTLNDIW